MDSRHWAGVVLIVLYHTTHNVNTGTDEEKFVTVGEAVKLQCSTKLSTAVDWKFKGQVSEKEFYIYSAGNLVSGYEDRFYVETSTKGDYNLVLRSALQSDTGLYTCTEDGGFGERHFIRLNVTETVCSPCPSTDYFIAFVIVLVLLIIAMGAVIGQGVVLYRMLTKGSNQRPDRGTDEGRNLNMREREAT